MSEVTAVPLRPIKKSALVALGGGIALLVAVGLGTAWAGTEKQVRLAMPPAAFLAANARRSAVKQTPSGLQYEVLTAGTGPSAQEGDLAKVDYDGRFVSGEAFDSSAKHGGATDMPVVTGGMIPGFVEALKQMNEGAKYRFWIPPELGYGPNGTPGGEIPPNAVLIFDVTLHSLRRGAVGAMGMGGMGGASPHGTAAGR